MNDYWMQMVDQAVSICGTPCYVYCWKRVLEAYQELTKISAGINVRHWLSVKTAPVKPLLSSWRVLGEGAEVVSEFELRAVLLEGFSPENILVNGVSKHLWLSNVRVPGLYVHFDSLIECLELAEIAYRYDWKVGLRIRCAGECDPDDVRYAGQFGIIESEIEDAIRIFAFYKLNLHSLHFHLRTNVVSTDSYRTALVSLAETCERYKLAPLVIDCGGGLPVPGERNRATGKTTWSFNLTDFEQVISEIPTMFSSVKEVWLENGRFLLARSGVLVFKVTDVKKRPEARYLICDGGRTNHAFVSDWEIHDVIISPRRYGKLCHTVICGPTCMAYDWLVRGELPNNIDVGDLIVWMNAGAYHIPWETRFSHGLASVVWIKDSKTLVARNRETFENWWGTWC